MFFDEFIGKLIPANFSFKTFTKTDITNEFKAKIDKHFSSDPDKHIVVPVINSTSARLEFEDQYVYDNRKRVEGEHKDFIKQHSRHVMSKLSLSDKALDNNAIPPKPICFLNEDLIEKKCDDCPFSVMKNFYSIKLKSEGKKIINKTDVDHMKDLIKANKNGEIDKFIKYIKQRSKISFPLQIPPDFNKFFWGDDELIEYLISISFYMHDWTKVVYFPSLFHTINIENKCPQRESGLFYQTNKKDDSNEHCRFLYNQFFMFTNILSLWATHDNILKHSAKAAVTAIMSRNLSHNIGSHVLSYWNQEIEEILKETFKAHFKYNTEQAALKKSKVLFEYIQHRMDFLAEVSTMVPCSELSLDFKQDILDPYFVNLNDDKFPDELKNQDKISTLLEGIAKSEGINLHNKIYLESDLEIKRVSIPNGLIGKHAIYSILENFIRNATKHYKGTTIPDDDEINVDKAKVLFYKVNDLMSKHIETIISNKNFNKIKSELAKKQSECNKLKDEANNKSIADIKRNINAHHAIQNEIPFIKIILKEPNIGEKWQKDFLVMIIWDMRENSCNREIVKKLRRCLPLPKRENNDDQLKPRSSLENDKEDRMFTDAEGNLIAGNWGMKEMLTCANFLRKNSPEVLHENISKGYKEGEPPLFEILCGDEPEGEPCCIDKNVPTNNCTHTENEHKNKLGIRLHLRKPKDLAVAVENITETDITKEKFGIEKVELPKDKDDKNKHLYLKEEIPHRILLVNTNTELEFYEDDPKAPCRIMLYDNTDRVEDKYYLAMYSKYIKDKLWDSEDTLPLIINNLDSDYYFADIKDLSISLHEENKHYGNIFFVAHPEKQNTEESFFNDCYYFQPISGSFSTKAKLYKNSKLDEDIRTYFYHELREAAITKVVIVDERISSWAQKDSPYFSKKIKEILKKMNVYIVDIKVKDHRIKTNDLETELNNASSECFKVFECEKKDNAHFFVIHQGILDKLDDNPEAFMRKINCRWKVVDSGRGVPDKIFENTRFVELSALQSILANYDKHGLVQMLFSLRQPKKP